MYIKITNSDILIEIDIKIISMLSSKLLSFRRPLHSRSCSVDCRSKMIETFHRETLH